MSFNKEDLAADEATILRGYVDPPSTAFHTNASKRPQTGQLSIYKDALERLNASIAFNTTNVDVPATVRIRFSSITSSDSQGLFSPAWWKQGRNG